MKPIECHFRTLLGSVLSLALVFLLALTFGAAEQAKAGGKPPKQPPPSFDPVLVYQVGTDLIVADATGTNSRIIHQLGGAGGTADWSPNGTEIVFVDLLAEPLGDCAAGWALLRLNVLDAIAGSHEPHCVVQLHGQSLEVNSPSWTVSGIIYADLATVDNITQWDLFWVDPLGGEPVNLTKTELYNEEFPTVSPAGDKVVYVRYDPESPDDLMIASFDTANGLTRDQSLIAGTGLDGFDNIQTPDWSNQSDCDGRIAVFASSFTSPYVGGIWVLNVNPDESGNCPADPTLLTGDFEWVHGTPSWSAGDTDIVLLTHLKNTCGYNKGANGFLLGIIPWTGDAVPCADQFIGPAGRSDFPRSLDWRS